MKSRNRLCHSINTAISSLLQVPVWGHCRKEKIKGTSKMLVPEGENESTSLFFDFPRYHPRLIVQRIVRSLIHLCVTVESKYRWQVCLYKSSEERHRLRIAIVVLPLLACQAATEPGHCYRQPFREYPGRKHCGERKLY